jgi:hypothetical protein
MKKLFNYILIIVLLLIALVLADIVRKHNQTKPPTERYTPTDTTKTQSITDETWFWLMLAS